MSQNTPRTIAGSATAAGGRVPEQPAPKPDLDQMMADFRKAADEAAAMPQREQQTQLQLRQARAGRLAAQKELAAYRAVTEETLQCLRRENALLRAELCEPGSTALAAVRPAALPANPAGLQATAPMLPQ